MTRPSPADPSALAPHVDKGWADAFVLELRLLDVPGDRIGDALAEVEAHCRDSGEPAAEAFDEPVAYARSLDLPAVPAEGDGVGPVVLGSVLQVAALFAVPTAVGVLGGTGAVEVAGGVLVTAVVTLVVIALLGVAHGPFLRAVVHRPVVAWLVVVAAMVAAVLPAALWRDPVLALPAAGVLAVGLLLLIAGAVVQHRALGEGDPVVAPAGSTAASSPADPDGADARRSARRTTTALSLLVPVATVLLSALAWVTAG
ncbi:hypothetical protein [Cellulomonas marina]|uniref:Uncharacterized protein n=1 Tax=Cellulomonas marina TaxID=988821 RepID=A0A1I0XG35_9CELL|nr:hypothetical protein [Cellulomonas marina]GIG29848.1 hypothetical protein Cma02nite_24480 [Cellulomonas marina]SFA99951.1 hypothetical protein SAMN05421867_10531 [Cellulomonas marina]